MLSYLVVKDVEKRFSSICFLGLEDKIYVVYKNTHTHTPKKKRSIMKRNGLGWTVTYGENFFLIRNSNISFPLQITSR